LDLLIKYFGPKGAFPTETAECPSYGTTPTPSATPAASLLPNPSGPASSNPWASPSPTPTPSPSPVTYYFRLRRCIENPVTVSHYYTEHSSGYLSVGTPVWGAVECDPDYAYVVVGSTLVESDYAGFTKLAGVTLSAFLPCYDCNGEEIISVEPPAYTQIQLARQEGESDPAGWLCGQSFYNGNNIKVGYIQMTPIVSYTSYTVYNEPDGTSLFDGESKTWAIYYNTNPVVVYTVYVTSSGDLGSWTACP
jgi:hypothetical protein